MSYIKIGIKFVGICVKKISWICMCKLTVHKKTPSTSGVEHDQIVQQFLCYPLLLLYQGNFQLKIYCEIGWHWLVC